MPASRAPQSAAEALPQGEAYRPPMDRDEALLGLPEALPGTDPVEHERDILYITNLALESGEVHTMNELVEWLNRQMSMASRAGMIEEPHHMLPPIPDIVGLSKYLRAAESIRGASRRVRGR